MIEDEYFPNEQEFFAGVYSVIPDKKRRIVLPQTMFGDISDNDELVIVGVGDHCEIWRKETWEQVSDTILQLFNDEAKEQSAPQNKQDEDIAIYTKGIPISPEEIFADKDKEIQLVELSDDDGGKMLCKVLDIIEYNGNKYRILALYYEAEEYELDSPKEVFVTKEIICEDNPVVEIVEDEEGENIYNLFKAKHANELDFTD